MLYKFLVSLSDFFCMLSPGIARGIGKVFGELTWLAVPKKRKNMAKNNIVRALKVDEKEAGKIAKASWVRFGPMMAEVLRFPVISKHIDDYVTVIGEEYIEEAKAYDRGGVIATSHSGNWELIGMVLSDRGMKIAGVAQHQRNEQVNDFINYCRSFTGMHITDKLDIKEMISMLNHKYFIGLIMDQDGGGTGVMMNFLGREASCVQGPAVLSRFKKAPILPVFITEDKERPGHHILTVEKPVFTPVTKNKTEDMMSTLAKLNKRVEDNIYQHPREWFWLHDRWKFADRQRAQQESLRREKEGE